MKCLRCHAALTEKLYDGVKISNCEKCGGIWLDAGKLQPILHARGEHQFSPELIQKTLSLAHTGIPKAEVDAQIACPKCSAPMNAMNYDYNSGIILNVCPKGEGLWFDKDELEEAEIFTEHWEQKIRKDHDALTQLTRQAEVETEAELDEEESRMEKHLGPISQILSAVMYHLEKMTQKK